LRVLELITPSRLGGAERYVGWIVQELINRGHEVLIGIRPCEPVEQFYSSLGPPMKRLAISGKLNPFAKSRTVKLIREFQPDIVHTHLSTASHWGLKAAVSAGVPGVGHMHSFNSIGPYKNATRIISVSNAVKNHLCEHGFDNVDVVYPASPILNATPASDILQLGKHVVACAARLREDKGIKTLATAFAMVQRELPGATLVICGDGPLRTELEELAKETGLRLTLAGYRDDVPSVFAASAVAVLPSLRPEGYGMVLYEAQAVGTPVVASEIGGATEAVGPESGFLVPPGSATALASAILDIIGNPEKRSTMSAAALRFARTRNMKSSVDALLNVFNKL
jgi:glycosyltransferase involved in cell wall biosynthesis